MAEESDIASDVIDAARLEAVRAALGMRRLNELMLILAGRVHSLAAKAEIFPEAAEECLMALHQSRGSAASLGLVALAEGLARMEAEASKAQHDPAAMRAAARALPGLWKAAAQAKEALLF